ncbi:MAG: outer membrane beta-barrel protein [Brumimicrobium sp.]|nr:outer membrane beta-barrel protein [Brumimicrobium sp.]
MKKLLTIVALFGVITGINAQDAAEKKILAGLTLGAGMNFNNPETVVIDSKVGSDFVVGMAFDWHFTNSIALSTGLEFDFNRFRHQFLVPTYFDYADKEIIQRGSEDEINTPPAANLDTFHLDERRYRNIYLSIPVMLRFQTNYMGYLRYFGKFGIRNSFLLTSRVDNFGNDFNDPSVTELEDFENAGDLSFYKGSIGLSLGAEWNFTGSTCLVGELGYYYGFSEIHQQDAIGSDSDRKKSLYNDPTVAKVNREYFTPSAKQGQLLFKISFLF